MLEQYSAALGGLVKPLPRAQAAPPGQLARCNYFVPRATTNGKQYGSAPRVLGGSGRHPPLAERFSQGPCGTLPTKKTREKPYLVRGYPSCPISRHGTTTRSVLVSRIVPGVLRSRLDAGNQRRPRHGVVSYAQKSDAGLNNYILPSVCYFPLLLL